jgi:hypothetical protein
VYFTYELTVEPGQILSGGNIGAFFEGSAEFGAEFLNQGLALLPVGFRRVAITEFQATVQVRQGAEGEDVVLKASPIENTCTYNDNGMKDPDAVPPFPTCLPTNDHEDGSNDDCIGLGGAPHRANRCLPYVEVEETSDDCSAGGRCAELGQTGTDSPCELHRFCIVKGMEIALERGDGAYIADTSGSVLFGWAEPQQGIGLLQEGPNRGAYDPSKVRRLPGQELGPNGIRALVAGIPMAFECVMGVNSRGPDGVATVDPLLSRSPDGVLISCPIQEPE